MHAALYPDNTAMCLDEGLTDGQSKTRPARTLLATMPRPVEPLEHVW